METILRRTCAPWILLFSAGCAADDLKSVPLPAFESFDLGKTRYAQVVERMGEPNFGSQILIDGKTVKSVSYTDYVDAAGRRTEEGKGQVRSIHYYFNDNVLVGEHFKSPIRSEASGIDTSKLAAITKGRTSRADVVRLLGAPTGAYIPPMASTAPGETTGYRCVLTYLVEGGIKPKGNQKLHDLREMRIGFDEKDMVAGVFNPAQ